MTPDQNGPIIQAASHILLTREEKGVLRAMFDSFSRLAIEAEFGSGYSGSRVFRVHPVDDRRKAQRPAVVKIAPIDLIVKERHAYEAWVETTLPRVARLVPSPMSSPGSELGGLRYDLVGGEIFELQSLHDFYGQASIEDLLWVLKERLFPLMSQSWWLDNRLERAHHMQVDYGRLLPVNLLITTAIEPLIVDSVHRIEPGRRPTTIAAGDRVLVQGFVVAEKDLKQRQLTLMLPSVQEDPSAASYRLRLTDVPDLDRYQVGSVVETIPGVAKATRHDLLVSEVTETLGRTTDLSAEQLDLSDDVLLPNPLTVYQDILDKFSTVRISIIHGDLNLENILVDPDTREIRLIDFATVREGHVLHDLLRLETQVVTRLIPEALTGANLPVETTIHHLYRRLHEAMVYSGRDVILDIPHPELKKSFAMLVAIRQEARNYLFLPGDWTEYYQGLVIYLLGTLKFKNLDATAKQVAFWGAAMHVDLINRPEEIRPHSGDSVLARRERRFPLLPSKLTMSLIVLGLLSLIILILPTGMPGSIALSFWPLPATTPTLTATSIPTASPIPTATLAPMPDTGFNIGVAQFTTLDDTTGNLTLTQAGREVSDWLFFAVEEETNRLPSTLRVTVREPDDIGIADRDTAAQVAAQHNATLLIYGVITRSNDSYYVQPEFYVSQKGFSYGSEVVGPDRLGQRVPFDLPLTPGEFLAINEKLNARTQALQHLVNGLASFYVNRYDEAWANFQQAVTVDGWEEDEGQEVVYLLMGAAKLRAYRDPKTEHDQGIQSLNQAYRAFERASEINPDYARSYLGLGSIALQQATVLNPKWPDSLDISRLSEAEVWYLKSLNVSDQPASAYVPVKATFGLGQVRRLEYEYHLSNTSGDEARSLLERVVAASDMDRSPDLIWFIGHAHAELGRLAGLDKDYQAMSDMYGQAIDLLNSLPADLPYNWIADYWAQVAFAENMLERPDAACEAYRQAIENGTRVVGSGQKAISPEKLGRWKIELVRLEEGTDC